MRLAAVVACALALVGCAARQSTPEAAAVPGAAGDVRALVAHLRTVHPDVHHAVGRARLDAERDALARRAPGLDRDELLVGLMRLAALAGVRDGHTGIFPLDPTHREPLHLFPLRLYGFPEGVFVVGEAGRRGLVGKRLVAIEGVPVGDVLARVRPLVPRDNEHSLRARAVQWAVTAEVLHGLGLTEERLRARFRFADGTETALTAVPADRYTAAFADFLHPMIPHGLPRRPRPAFLQHRNRAAWTAVLAGGRAVYVAYNFMTISTFDLARRVERLARGSRVRRVVLDLRHNPGGNYFTAGPLLETLTSLPRGVQLDVLVGRTTFSAAQMLAVDLERRGARFLGEPTGGSPNLYGDPAPRQLDATGWTVHAATVHWQRSTRGDRRLTLRPDVLVPLRAADVFAGRDPVLSRALAGASRA